MNLNPFYHWKRYRLLCAENERLREQAKYIANHNNSLLQRNEELVKEKQKLLRQLDEYHEPEHQPIIVKHSHRNRKGNI
ncbi:hypothetical protein PTQ27_09065 [Mannheimia sp. AT1]|uniref:Transposase n=1 Tax=Mannheimia cairinae TaxID=3025936 RepID=A0ABT5MSN1_9PAST|nr:hypothetical protein [Mannheimia cairinae]MDD0824606.1 hypothetical protein [Mannheimia cairinae]MDD0826465.1 hypothetical protein [Mannheimia cairinae]